MGEVGKGILSLIGACVIWGLAPLFYKLISHIEPTEVVSHRMLWSLMFFGFVLLVQGKSHEVRALLNAPRAILPVAIAALLISANWFLFIVAIQINRAVEASLGYYIFPLIAVFLGWLVLGERLSRVKWLAVGLAAGAVIVLTVGLGVAPWISLVLATTFAFYGLMKRRSRAGAMVSVTAEVLLVAPLPLVWLIGVHFFGWTGLSDGASAVFLNNWRDSVMLMLSGPLTAAPLILFSYATTRITLATVGLIQYLNPTLQFFCAVAIFGEPFGLAHAIAFGLIWLALAIYSAEALRQEKLARRAASSAGTSSKDVR